MNQNVRITNPDGTIKLVSLAAFVGGAYGGWTLAEGQHWAVKIAAGLIGGAGASAVAGAVLG